MYSLVGIISADNKSVDQKKKIEELVGKKGKLIKKEDLGKRALAYPIQKNQEGRYFSVDFEIAEKDLPNLKQAIDEINILRYLITIKPKGAKKKEKITSKPKEKKPVRKKPASVKKAKPKKPKKVKKAKPKKPKQSEKERLADLDKKLDEIL